ncbi:MAG TPA: S9 family peptidase [Candidatus Eremiobacteraceae bacterium]|nr:S9 family peptidase [Candidatus Eremiobacteraceae bacterium]
MTHGLFNLFVAMVLTLPVAAAVAPADVATYLQIKGQTGPSLSPDGSLVAFSFAGSGVSQVWMAPIAGGEPTEVTSGPERADFKAWSPVDPNLIIFGRDRGGDENWNLIATDPSGARLESLTADAGIQHNFGGFSFDGKRVAFASNERDREFFDVYTLALAHGAQPSRVLQQDSDNRPVAWSHDGNSLLVSIRRDNFDNDLLLIDLRRDAYLARLLTAHSGNADFESCHFSSDDTKLYCVSDYGGREYRGRAVIDIAGGKHISFLDDGPYDVDSLTISRDGTKMAYVRNRDGYGELIIADVATGKTLATPALPPGVAAAPTFSAKGDELAFEFSGPANPGAIWVYSFLNKRARQVTAPKLAGIAPSTFVQPSLVSFPSFDGRSIPAWYYKPKNASGPLPVIVDVHGGPEAQARPVFNPITQYFIARGYAVLVPNVRGSSGYGNTYLHLADVRKRQDSVKDLHAAHDWLIAHGGADPKRIALYGGSYGGYMVLAGLTEFPDDWAAGVDIVGISDFVTFLEHTSSYRRANREGVYGSLAQDRDFLESISPLNHIDSVVAPLIIFMGANDPRVPAAEGQQMADALRAKGVPVELTVFPDEGHGIARDANRIVAYTQIAVFLDRYIGPGQP